MKLTLYTSLCIVLSCVQYVCLCLLKGGMDLIETLKQDSQMMADKDCVSGISDMETLLEYCDLYGVQDKVRCSV